MISAAVQVQGRWVDRSPCRRRAGRWRRRRARRGDPSSYNDASSRTGGAPSRGRRPGSGRTRWRTSRTFFPVRRSVALVSLRMRARGRGRRGSPGDSGATNARFEGIAENFDGATRASSSAPRWACRGRRRKRAERAPAGFRGRRFLFRRPGRPANRIADSNRGERTSHEPSKSGLPTWHLIASVMTWHPPQPLSRMRKKSRRASGRFRCESLRAV